VRDHGEVHNECPLPLLRQNVVEVGVHFEVRICHGGEEQFFLVSRQLPGKATALVYCAEYVEEVRESVQHTARIEIAKSEHPAVSTASVVREDRLQSGMALRRRAPLFSGIAGYTHHAHIPVTPGLTADPVDHVVMVGIFVTVMPFRFGGSSRLGDHMDIAVGNETSCIAGFERTEPERDIRRLRSQHVGHVRALHVFVVQGGCVKHRVRSGSFRPIHIQGEMDSVPHPDPQVALFNHAGRSP
jgi:hypothetical protein